MEIKNIVVKIAIQKSKKKKNINYYIIINILLDIFYFVTNQATIQKNMNIIVKNVNDLIAQCV